MTIIYLSLPFFADCDFPLVKELRKQGCRVIHIIPITPQCLKSTLIDISKQYPLNGIFKTDIYDEIKIYSEYLDEKDTYIVNRNYTSKHLFKRLKSTFQLLKLIRSFRPDYVWTSSPFGFYDLILYTLPNIVLTVHDPFPHSGENNTHRSITEKIAFKLCKKFVLLNSKQSSAFINAYHIKPSSVLINRLGTYDCIKIFASKNEDSVPPYPYVLFYGRISPYKGIEYLLESFLKIHETYPELHLIIAGGGKYHFDISPYHKLDYIEFRNYHVSMDETVNLFQHTKFVVCPYLDATQSGVIMTAYTMNKAVIATKVGALEETVINGETGLTVAPADSKELYDAISQLYSQPELLTRIEENIKNKYQKGNDSWTEIAQKYISFFQQNSSK